MKNRILITILVLLLSTIVYGEESDNFCNTNKDCYERFENLHLAHQFGIICRDPKSECINDKCVWTCINNKCVWTCGGKEEREEFNVIVPPDQIEANILNEEKIETDIEEEINDTIKDKNNTENITPKEESKNNEKVGEYVEVIEGELEKSKEDNIAKKILFFIINLFK